MAQTATRTDKLKAAHERLQQAVESIVSGDDWQRMLEVASGSIARERFTVKGPPERRRIFDGDGVGRELSGSVGSRLG
jgi:hypothetical protein